MHLFVSRYGVRCWEKTGQLLPSTSVPKNIKLKRGQELLLFIHVGTVPRATLRVTGG